MGISSSDGVCRHRPEREFLELWNGCSLPSQISLPRKEAYLCYWSNNLPGFAILNKDSCFLLVFHFPLIFQRIRVNINSALWCQQNPGCKTGMCCGTGDNQFWLWWLEAPELLQQLVLCLCSHVRSSVPLQWAPAMCQKQVAARPRAIWSSLVWNPKALAGSRGFSESCYSSAGLEESVGFSVAGNCVSACWTWLDENL